MSPFTVAERAVVERSFREWQVEHAQLEAQLAESLAALDAYQCHLDNWQRELVIERDELHELRAAIERQRSADECQSKQLDENCQELSEAHQKINTLTEALLTRTEELRNLDHERNAAHAELAVALAREKELTALLAAQRADGEAQRQQWEYEAARAREESQKLSELVAANNSGESGRSGHVASEKRPAASPVLGSVMEQFGKLRQQRSMNRLNPKPR